MTSLSKITATALAFLLCASLISAAFAQTTPSKPQRRADFRALTLKNELGKIPPDALLIAKAQAAALTRPPKGSIGVEGAGITSASWQALGPGNIGGRVRAIAIHPTNSNRIVMGAVTGGIWTSDNAGASWAKVNDWLPSLAISSITYSPSSPNILYAGTGESFTGGEAPGAGVFKSVDGGNSWARLAATNPAISFAADLQWRFVNSVAVHPTNSQIIYAATGSVSTGGRLMRSLDSGSSWAEVVDNVGTPVPATTNVRFNPSNVNNIIATAGDAGLYYSTDGGQTGFRRGAFGAGSGRAEIAFAANGWVFAFRQFAGFYPNSVPGGVFRSQDGGANWALLSTPGDTFAPSQLWYNNTIWVDPTNANNVVIGGKILRRSSDGGLNWNAIGGYCQDYSFHADQHTIVADPAYNGTTNRKIYVGNDGGVYRADDLNTAQESCAVGNGWTNLNNGLFITQFTGGAGSPTLLFGGTQDNGTLIRESVTSTSWRRYAYGDGGPVAYAPNAAPNHLFGQYQDTPGSSLHVSSDAGGVAYADTVHAGLGCRGGIFYPPMLIDSAASAWLTVGAKLCVSENPTNANRSWRAIPLAAIGEQPFSIAMAPNNKNVIWYADPTNGTMPSCVSGTPEPRCPIYGVFKSTNGLATAPTWTPVGAGLPQGRTLTRIFIDPKDPSNNTVYVGYGGFTTANLWKTTNGGLNWTNIHGTLPAAPIRAITTHPTIPNYLYVGTEVGLFTSENGGTTWFADLNNQPQNDGPANVSIEHLFWTDNQTLVAATYGRGMFKAVIAPNTLASASTTRSHGGVVIPIAHTAIGLPSAGIAASAGGVGIAVESRCGSLHNLLLTFSGTVTSGSASIVTCAIPDANLPAPASSPCVTPPTIGAVVFDSTKNTASLPLSGVTNQSRVWVRLSNLNAQGVDADVAVGFLCGDTNGNGTVQGGDVNFAQLRLGQTPANTANFTISGFRADVDANGVVQGGDVNAIQLRLGTRLP
jgi:hypothetical protein